MDLKQRSLVAQGVAAFQAAVSAKKETVVPRPSQSPTKIIQGERYGEHSSPDLMEAYINRDVVSKGNHGQISQASRTPPHFCQKRCSYPP